MQPTRTTPDRTLLVIVAIIAAVVALALVVVFTRGAPPALDPATPQGVVQSYATAVVDGDRAAAAALLTAEIRDNCERADPGILRDVRLTIVSATVSANTAVVRVSITQGSGGGLMGGSRYSSDDSFSLIRENASWRIDSAPWEFMVCYNLGSGQ